MAAMVAGGGAAARTCALIIEHFEQRPEIANNKVQEVAADKEVADDKEVAGDKKVQD